MAEATHASDCAVHSEPAFPAGPCDCGADTAHAAQSFDQPLSRREKAGIWLGTVGGAWTAVMYWALFGWIGAVALAGAETIIAAVVFAYWIGGESDA